MMKLKDENENIIERRQAAMVLAEDIMTLLNSNFTFFEIRPLAEKRAAELKHLLCADHFADAGKMVENGATCKDCLQVAARTQEHPERSKE